ncbi:hypothetical protein H9P43_002396 [Blastocladiella emersonii ATCC 22665]|nr:hypothetical protein H9P43_002396 [Blastocladiella emersonii ATCC 22665]
MPDLEYYHADERAVAVPVHDSRHHGSRAARDWPVGPGTAHERHEGSLDPRNGRRTRSARATSIPVSTAPPHQQHHFLDVRLTPAAPARPLHHYNFSHSDYHSHVHPREYPTQVAAAAPDYPHYRPPRREFFVFDREKYRLMELSLQTPATPHFPAGLTRKRWRRIMSYLELRPENPPRRTLTWKGCALWLAPAEDWRDIILRKFHLPPNVAAADPAGASVALMGEHRTFTQTLKLVARRYQTRRSRAGIPLELVEQVCHECPCYARQQAVEAAVAAAVAIDGGH